MIQVLSMMCQRCDGWVPFWDGEKKTCTCEKPLLGQYSVGTSHPKKHKVEIKKVDRSKDAFIRTISMEERFPAIMSVLKNAEGPLSAPEICDQYIVGKVMASDPLSTGHILNVLSMAGVVRRIETFKGKSVRVKYELA